MTSMMAGPVQAGARTRFCAVCLLATQVGLCGLAVTLIGVHMSVAAATQPAAPRSAAAFRCC